MNTLPNLFERNETLTPSFNFWHLLKRGYRYTPRRSKIWIYPFIILMLVIAILGVTNYFLSKAAGMHVGVLPLILGVVIIGIVLLIYVGTARYWQKEQAMQIFYAGFAKDFVLNRKDAGINFLMQASGQVRSAIKTLTDGVRYYPSIHFIFSKNLGKARVHVGSFTRTSHPRYGRPSGSRQDIAFVLIQHLPKSHAATKIDQKDAIENWFSTELNWPVAELKPYIYLLRIQANQCLLEFHDDIQIPQNKLALLKYLGSK